MWSCMDLITVLFSNVTMWKRKKKPNKNNTTLMEIIVLVV